jgi:peroxiredoxin
MTSIFYSALSIIIFSTVFGQSEAIFPDLQLETTKNRVISSSYFKQTNHPKVIVFWLTSSRDAIQELNALELKKSIWNKSYETQIISISLDNYKKKTKVISFVNSNGWTFDCYLDTSKKSMIELKGKNVPLTFIINETGEIVSRLEGFDSRTIDKIQDQLIKMSEQ